MDTTARVTVLTTRPAAPTFKRGVPTTDRATTTKILEVVGADGTVVQHMCAECGKTGPTFHSILGHLKQHGESPKATLKSGGVSEFLREHARLQRENNRLLEKLKKERAARARAERRLQQIDDLFSGKSK